LRIDSFAADKLEVQAAACLQIQCNTVATRLPNDASHPRNIANSCIRPTLAANHKTRLFALS